MKSEPGRQGFAMLLLSGFLALPAAGGARVDYYDEALRLFGTASSGRCIAENRAREGNRIIYDKNGI